MKKIYTNVIAGIYKNKKILLPPLENTRASKSILKESFFNTISFDMQDKVFVEVFAGSGSMGIEAISRGASEVVFFEKNNEAFDILKKNLSDLKINNATSILGDSFLVFWQNIQTLSNKKSYFYFDPPFSFRQDYSDVYNQTIKLISKIDKNMVELICIEHMSSIVFDESIGCFSKIKEKKFGKSKLSYFKALE